MNFRPCLFFAASLALVTTLLAQPAPAPKLEFPTASPIATLKQRVGVTDIEIVYSRPSVKGRKIFGGLRPYDETWRTGANNATRVSFSTPVKLNGNEIPEGTYELFTIPGRTQWTVMLQKAQKQWGDYAYDSKNDVVRFTTQATTLPMTMETFTIGIGDLRDTSATLYLVWETTLVPIKIEIDTVGALRPQIAAAMAAPSGKKPYNLAAMFYYENNLDLRQAAEWIDAAIAERPDSAPLVYRRGLILAKLGDKAGATAAAKKSLELISKEKPGSLKEEYTRLNEQLLATLN